MTQDSRSSAHNSKLTTYYHTLKHLKLSQLFWQVHRRLLKPKVSLMVRQVSLNEPDKERWVDSVKRQRRFFKKGELTLINKSVPVANIWQDAKQKEKLWRYNLHYFEYLLSEHSEDVAQGLKLLEEWLSKFPAYAEDAWEPYPISLRIVNLIKFYLTGGELSQQVLKSLYVQARYLAKIPEYHILGNHLFENAKALVFAGLFFSGAEAQNWFQLGCRILKKQIPEQILDDGGHFELSPMYHAIILEGMLDLCNIFQAYGKTFPEAWDNRLPAMLDWLNVMIHPDGEVSYFNDSTIGIAASPEQLFDYAERLGFAKPQTLCDGVYHLTSSGYVRLQKGPWVVLLDCAEVGPPYQPGHAHADTLSFELSFDGERMIINTGTSTYHRGGRRVYERKTRAHSCIELSGEDSSQVWGCFRVGRRARPHSVSLHEDKQNLTVECAHDGYKRLGVVCQRRWQLSEDRLKIEDVLSRQRRVTSSINAIARFYVNPLWGVSRGTLFHSDGRKMVFDISGEGAKEKVSSCWVSRGMGRLTQASCLCVAFQSGLSVTFERMGGA